MIFKVSLRHLLSRPFSSFLTVIAISSALTLLGVFWTLVENLERVRLKQDHATIGGEVLPGLTVFADPTLKADQMDALKVKLLENKVFKSAEIISSAEAMKALEGQFGETLSKVFSGDQLPFTLRLEFQSSSMTRDDLVALLNTIRGLPGVLDVDDGLSLLSEDKSNLSARIFSWATVLLMSVFVVVALLVSHMIRLAFDPLAPEVDTLRVLGASRSWVFLPLLIEGLFFGLVGSLMSFALLQFCLRVILPNFSVALLPKDVQITALSGVSSLELIGLSLGAALVGSFLTWPMVNRPSEGN